MGLNIPSRQGVVGTVQAYIRNALPELDPTTTRRSYIGGLVKSLGSALHDWYVALKRYADNEPFPQKASKDFLYNGWWRDITKLDPLGASQAQGRIVLQGTAGTILTAGAVLSNGSVTYTLDSSTAVVAQSLQIASLTRSGSTVIAETVEPHYLATGMVLTLSGATPADYNGAQTITVTADNEFTYQISTTPVTPATGTIIVSGTWGNGLITALDTGPSGNVDAGGTLSISGAPLGLNSQALVTWGAIAGGSDPEDIEDYRARVIEALGTDFGMFSAAEIKIIAKTVAGVTRVWVREATLGGTNGVLEGQVKIAFVRDGDANIFPSAYEVEMVRSAVLEIKPAHTAAEDVIVASPDPLSVDFVFSDIVPATASMRRAITATLEQFFAEAVDYGTDITEDDYRCAIKATYDREAQVGLKIFTLSSPSGDITVADNELPVLGSVTFT